jgi:large subunit ribosomal protein L4
VHRALVYQLANARTNVAHTKTRGERRGSTRKIYRQKGTGRARMGSNRSPIRKKG